MDFTQSAAKTYSWPLMSRPEGESLGVPLDDTVWAIVSEIERWTGSVTEHEPASAGRKVLAHEYGMAAARSWKHGPGFLDEATEVGHVKGGVRNSPGRRSGPPHAQVNLAKLAWAE